MRGAGSKMASIANRSVPVLLDITRLTSRVGRGPLTGVDRVEAAYLDWCLDTDREIHCIARVAGGFVLLNRSVALIFREKLRGNEPWGCRDFRAFVGIKTPKDRGRAESDLRRLATARSGREDVAELLDSLNGPQSVYLNVGHSNLGAEFLSAIASLRMPSAVFIHDVIPLEHPEFQRPGTVEKFERKMRNVAANANLLITNSNDSARRIGEVFASWGSVPDMLPSHLGATIPEATAEPRNRPYFVILGTIEPRKNHELLLGVWTDLSDEFKEQDMPELHIIGQRGWSNEEVFARLDRLPDKGSIIEENALSDEALWGRLKGAKALLFPSFAEGFGLPSLEAAALGVPVVCGDLAIHREVLGDYPVYLDVNDQYRWKKTIVEMTKSRQERVNSKARPPIPTWLDHFEQVNERLKSLV